MVRKKPQVPNTARQAASLPGDISRGKRSSIYLGLGVSLHGCSSKEQPLLLTLDEQYLLTAAPPDLILMTEAVENQGGKMVDWFFTSQARIPPEALTCDFKTLT